MQTFEVMAVALLVAAAISATACSRGASEFVPAASHRQAELVLQAEQKALEWIRLATQQGYTKAQAALGAMYALGQGVPRDRVQALMRLNLAATRGDEGGNEGARRTRHADDPASDRRSPASDQGVEAGREAAPLSAVQTQ